MTFDNHWLGVDGVTHRVNPKAQGSLLCLGLARGLVAANAVGLRANLAYLAVTATGDFDLAAAEGTNRFHGVDRFRSSYDILVTYLKPHSAAADI